MLPNGNSGGSGPVGVGRNSADAAGALELAVARNQKTALKLGVNPTPGRGGSCSTDGAQLAAPGDSKGCRRE